jgi:uncharacterized membrane protein (DUF2068 family)
MARRVADVSHRPLNRYELLTCAWKGHALVGIDAAYVGEEDSLVVRQYDGVRWHRCLRCDDWIMHAIPSHPARERPESRDEIAVPERGPMLRDRYVLRLIALDRAVHVVVLSVVAVLLLSIARHNQALHRDYIDIMNDLSGGDPGASKARGFLGTFGRVFKYSSSDLTTLGLVLAGYAVLEGFEMVGLWLAKRWAEYLTFIATTLLVPYEIYELTKSISTFKAITFVINVAIVVYLLLAKRLFGLRGGNAAEVRRREALGGWEAIEKATIPPNSPIPANRL